MHLLQLSGLWKKCAAVCGCYFWNILTLECEEIALVYNETALYLELSIHISSEMFWGYVVFLQKTNGEKTTTKHGESKKRAIFSETIGPFCLPKKPNGKQNTHTQKKKRPIPETASQCWWADCDPYRWSKSPLVYRTGDSVATGLAHHQNDLKSVSLTLKIPRWRSYSDFWLGFAWPWCCGIRCFLEKVSKT